MKKFLIVTFCVLSFSGTLKALSYESVRLLKLGSELNIDSRITSTFRDTTLYQNIKGRNIVIRINPEGEISHLGYALFPDSISLQVHPQLLRFIERMSLEAAYPIEKEINWSQQLKDYGLYFTMGSFADISNIKWDDSTMFVSIVEREKSYIFSLSYHRQQTCQLFIPKDYQLISGKDKLELDESLFRVDTKSLPRYSPAIDTTLICPVSMTSYSYLQGGTFLSNLLTNTLYLQRKKDEYSLLFSPYIYPNKTISNLMLCGGNKPINMELTHHRYGGATLVDTISLNSWVDLAYSSGCVPYWGEERYDNMDVDGAYVWWNSTFGYLHVMFVNFPIRALVDDTVLVRCSLHSFVRLSNVTELFFENNHNL